jgi:hypothetical protein
MNDPIKCEQRITAADMQPYGGHAFAAVLPPQVGPGDSNGAPRQSRLLLFENGRLLGPAHQTHQLIMAIGRGGYSHWDGHVVFASSDNSDPRANARRYTIGIATEKETHRITLDRFESYFYPAIVGLETMNACNARCPFCPLFRGNAPMSRQLRPPTIMSDAHFERCVQEIASWPRMPNAIFLNMNGEPLQDPKIANRLATIRHAGLGPLVCIQTNGQFLDDGKSLAILDADIREIAIGFDGATKATYEAHRVRCDYERVLGNIRRFARLRDQRAAGTRITIKFVRTRKNDHEIAAAYRLFAGFLSADLDKFEDTLSVDWGDAGDSDPLFYVGKITKGTAAQGCSIFNDQMIVLADGLLAACCWDYNLSVSAGGFGDVFASGLLDTWRNPRRVDLLHKLFSGALDGLPAKCRDCPSLLGSSYAANDAPAFSDERVSKATYGFTYRFGY